MDTSQLTEYKTKLKDLTKKSVSFNIMNFASKDGFLTKNQFQKWQSIVETIPVESQAYIQTGLLHLKSVRTVYNEWIQKAEEMELKFKSDGKIVIND